MTTTTETRKARRDELAAILKITPDACGECDGCHQQSSSLWMLASDLDDKVYCRRCIQRRIVAINRKLYDDASVIVDMNNASNEELEAAGDFLGKLLADAD